MKILEERIRKDGIVLDGDILRVDSFLNHQIDPELMMEMAEEFKRLFAEEHITKILTVEASGIAIACMCGYVFHVPVLFAKKAKTSNLDKDVCSAPIHSYTHQTDGTVLISKQYLNDHDRVLIIDDFLANGCACQALITLCTQASAQVAGIGICIEKSWQEGGKHLREAGYHVESLARIASMDHGNIVFLK
jgi:xanthine phosphoribosyltransferase